jgi:endonuclease V-like protein UPF0215 family
MSATERDKLRLRGGPEAPQVRIVGFDDGPFPRHHRGDVIVVGAMYRGGQFLDGMVATKVRRDGRNATARLIRVLTESRYYPQLHYLMLDGIALAGFNVVDIQQLWQETGLPVLVVVRRQPDLKAVRRALEQLPRGQARWRLIEKAGPPHELNGLFVQRAGLSRDEALRLLHIACTRSKIPEPLRAAHIIAGALVTGQGGRRA